MKEIASMLVERCLSRGAAAAEALIKTGAARTVSLESNGDVNWTRTAEGGIALRVFLGDGSAGFASLCGPAPAEETATHLVEAALDAARLPAPPQALPSGKPGDGRGLGIFDLRLHTATPADLEALLDDAASEALRSEPRVRRLDAASIAASSSEVWLANSAGLEGSYRQTLVRLSLEVVAGEGGASVVVRRSRTARSLAAFSPALFGDETARLAAVALERRSHAEGVFPALMAPAAAAEILRAYARALEPPGPPAGSSAGSRRLTLIDDGRLPGGIASAPFDGEGVPTRRTILVSRGRFGEMIHDLASGARHGTVSTGNGIRASFRDPPRRMPSNLFIAPSSDEPADLIHELREGIWIQSLRPTPAVLSDDSTFSAVATGRWVENGHPAAGIAGALVSWPISGLLEGVVGVGNDLTFGLLPGSFGAPSLLVRQIGLRAS